MATAIALTQCHGNLWHCGLTVSVKQLGAVEDNGIVLLSGTGKEAWHVDKRYDRNVESVAETYETGTFAAGVNVKHTGVN